jgi:hypothetical protein
LRFSHSGERHILGYGTDFFGIWERGQPGGPLHRFPRTDEGWAEAWNKFSGIEPRFVAIPRAEIPPDVRTSVAPFHSAHVRASWVVALLALSAVATLVSLVFVFMELDLLRQAESGNPPSVAEGTASDERIVIMSLVAGLVAIPTIVMWLVWQYRAHANLPALGAMNLRHRPGWAVGWWFIPVANAAMPYLTMRELHKASDPGAGAIDWKAKRTSPLLWLWWGGWLSGIVLNSIAAVYAAGPSPSLEGLITSEQFTIAGALVNVATAILAVLLVRTIDRRQRTKMANLAATEPDRAPAS